MYKIEVDRVKKLVKFDLTGFIKFEEVTAFDKELRNVLKQFKQKDVLIYGNMKGLKPTTQDILPVLQQLQTLTSEYGKKLATVQDNIITQMQMKRIGEEVNFNDMIRRFTSEQDAMNFLLE